MKSKLWIAGIGIVSSIIMAPTASWANKIEEPKGAVVDHNIDLAAEKAINQWISQLASAPHIDEIKTIGILPLVNDPSNFTELIAAKLTSLQRFRVVVLRGKAWDAIEDELARTDPDGGFGDVMDKASIKWVELRGDYALPETALGADAILLGHVRQIDRDWLRARVKLVPYLASVQTRSQIAGGIAEGSSVLSWKDILVYYKIQVIIGVAALVAIVIILLLLRGLVSSATRPR